jgi:hypothetical protein
MGVWMIKGVMVTACAIHFAAGQRLDTILAKKSVK